MIDFADEQYLPIITSNNDLKSIRSYKESNKTTKVSETMSEQANQARLDFIPIHNIKPSEVALRAVDRDSEKYLQLVESIRQQGVLTAITVNDLGEGIFGLVDGLHRFSAAKDAGLKTIPAQIREMTEAKIMEAQIIANLHKVDTKPMEYTRQLMRLCSANPMLTSRELAEKLGVTQSWLAQRLTLVDLSEPIQDLVNENKITLVNAYALAKLPQEEQAEYVDRAQTDPPTAFVPVVSARVKEIKDAARQGREAAPATFQPTARLQTLANVRAEAENAAAAGPVLASLNASSAIDGWKAALQWVLNMDPASVQLQQQTWEKRKKQREEEKEKAKKDREARKQKLAAEEAARIENL